MSNMTFKKSLCASVAVSLALVTSGQALASPNTDLGEMISSEVAEHSAYDLGSSALSDDAFTTLVQEQVAANPANAESIASRAKALRPHLSNELDSILESSLVADASSDALVGANGASAAGTAASTASAGLPSTALIAGGLAVAAAGGVALAASSGGGGSGNKAKGPEEPEPPPPPPGPLPGDYETDEYKRNWGLQAIGASHAYARGFTGEGVKVAVIDTGVDPDHPEFTGRLSDWFNAPHTSFCAGCDQVDMRDGSETGHGTHVTGIIGAAKDEEGMHGVAYNAEIIPISVIWGPSGDILYGTRLEALGLGIRHALESGAKVINNSQRIIWETDSNEMSRGDFQREFSFYYESLEQVVDNDAIMVVALGDDVGIPGSPQSKPQHPATAPLLNEGWKDYWIAVGGLDQEGVKMTNSLGCGVTAEWCIFAPGENIYSTVPGGYEHKSGTSLAAPMVSGAVALLREAFPHLEAPEITEIIFATADPLGPKEIYGHGALNLEKAFSPVGRLGVPMGADVNSRSIDLHGSSLRVSAAFGDGIGRALEGHSVMALDQFNRGYHFPLSGMTSSSVKESRKDALHRLKLFGGIEENSIHTVNTGPFSITTASRLRASDPSLGATPYSRMTLAFTGANYQAEVSMNPDLGRSFGFKESGFGSAPMIEGNSFDQPHLSLMETGFGSTLGFNLDDASTLRFGVYSGNVEAKQASLLNTAPTMYGAIAELDREFSIFEVRGSAGVVSEEGSLLGSVSKGAFGDDMRSTTFFANLGTTVEVTPRTKLTLAGSLGHSSFKQDSGLIQSGDNLITSSFGIGVSHADFLQEGDVFTLAAGQPVRIEGGKVNLSLPTSRDLEGGIDYRKVSLNPQPSGREINLQASYGFEVMDGVSTSVGAMHRFNANHVAGQSETVGMASLSFAF